MPAVINLKIKDLTFLKVLKVSPRLLLVYPFSDLLARLRELGIDLMEDSQGPWTIH